MNNYVRKVECGHIYQTSEGYHYAVLSVYGGVARVTSECGNVFDVDDARVYCGDLCGSCWHFVNQSGATDYQRIEEMEALLNV